MRTYVNARYDYSLSVPERYAWGREADNGDGRRFTDPDHDVTIGVWASHNLINGGMGASAQEYLDVLAAHNDLSYQVVQGDVVVGSWVEDNTIYYERTIVHPDIVYTVQIHYPTTDATAGSAAVEQIAHTLTAH